MPLARSFLAHSLLALLSAACVDAAAAPPEARSTTPAPAPSAPAVPDQSRTQASYLQPGATEWVAIGDLHGDLKQTRKALRLVGAIDERDRWIGEKLVVVQTGDVIDRGHEDREVIDLLEKLQKQAKAAGGRLVLLTGNHEFMNVTMDFRYVARESVPAFDSVGGRIEAFRPGGPYAQLLSSRPIVVQLGDTVFAHGGVLSKHVSYGLDRINEEARSYMRGTRKELTPLLASDDSPLWTRAYSDQTPDCAELEKTLKLLSAKRMVVGHTPQRDGINSACDGKIWRIDVGIAEYYGGPVQALKLQGEKATVLRDGN